jgi:tetratricopeptide (TPR) repeat protein
MAVPVLITMVVYFRFVMGFFMRNFERQADLFAATVMGSPRPVAGSLERIAGAGSGGRVRDAPSWHHFSIRERVECLERAERDPGLVKRHNRRVAVSLAVYLAAVGVLGWFLYFSGFKDGMAYSFVEKALIRQVRETPGEPRLYRDLAMVSHQLGKHREAILAYEKALALDPEDPVVLNNLAWLLLTAPDRSLRDEERALALAREAVARERSAPFLDTLAEAHHAAGNPRRALEVIQEALAAAGPGERSEYYEDQRRKFLEALGERPGS